MEQSEKNRKLHISMRTFILITVLLLIVGIMAAVSYGIIYLDGRNASSSLLDQTEEQAERLADRIALQHFRLLSSQNTLDSDLDETAFLAGGRILVVDRDYRIEKDTFVFQQDSYIISENVMKVMTGREEKISWIRNAYAEVILPIKNEKGETLGVIISTASTRAIEKRHETMVRSTLILCGIILAVAVVLLFLIAHLTVRGLKDMNRRIAFIS